MSVIRAGSRRAAVERPHAAASSRGDRLLGPARRAGRTASRRIDRLDVRLVGATPRVGLRLEQVVQALVAQPLDLGRRERRLDGRPRRQLERRRRGARPGTSTPTDVRPSPPRRGATRPAARRPRSARSRRGPRCPRSGARAIRTVAPPIASGSSAAPVRHDERRGDQLPPRQVDRDDLEPVRELLALDARELVRPRLPGRGRSATTPSRGALGGSSASLRRSAAALASAGGSRDVRQDDAVVRRGRHRRDVADLLGGDRRGSAAGSC